MARARAALLLALALLAAAAPPPALAVHRPQPQLQGPPESCGPPEPGAWHNVVHGEADAVIREILVEWMSVYGSNMTELMQLSSLPPISDAEVHVEGCAQHVKGGTNFHLWVNITAMLGEMDLQVGFTADAFQPLPTAYDTSIEIIDTDFDFIRLDGEAMLVEDHPDDQDIWTYDPALGTIVEDPNWRGHDTDSVAQFFLALQKLLQDVQA